MDKLELDIKTQNRIMKWVPIVAQCNQSGMNIRQWCKDNDIAYSTYCKYQRLVREAAMDHIPKETIFPVKVTEEKQNSVQITVNGYSLTFDESISDLLLNRIIRCCHD